MLAAYAAALLALPHGDDLAKAPHSVGSKQLSTTPPIYFHEKFFQPNVIEHIHRKIPKDEAAWEPCIGQKSEFATKRCTLLPVAGDSMMEAALYRIERQWDFDMKKLWRGVPLIRYLPGAKQGGLHQDQGHDGVVPNTTILVFLTDADQYSDGTPAGQTLFPALNVAVTPSAGSILAWQNVDKSGNPEPKSMHRVGDVPKSATKDRLVFQIPVLHEESRRAYAYPEHVSGNKKPGQHEALHGTTEQKAAYQAAIAAGASLALAYLAAKKGKWEAEMLKDDPEPQEERK